MRAGGGWGGEAACALHDVQPPGSKRFEGVVPAPTPTVSSFSNSY